MAIKRNIILNSIGQIGNKVVRIFEQLLLVPFFLSIWGPEYYGEWLTISIIPGVLAFSDLGFGTAVSNAFVLTYSKGDKNRASNIFMTGLIFNSLTVLLGVILSIVVIWGSWKLDILEKSIIAPSDIILSLSFLMASRLMAFYMQLFEGFFRAKSKASTAFNLYAIEGLLRIGIGVMTLLLGCNIVGYSFWQFILAIVFNLLFALWAKFLIRDLPRGHYDKRVGMTILKKGFGFMLTPVWQSIYLQGSTFVVRIVLGAETVAIFNTVRTVCKSINSAFSIIYGAIFPELQIAYGKEDRNLVKKIYIFAIQSVTIISLFGLIFLIICGPTIYAWWTHNELKVTNCVWYIFMLSIPLNALWFTAGSVFRAINKPMRFAVYGFISSVISTLISYILSYPLGLIGATIGFVTMDFIMLSLTLPLANKEMNVNPNDLLDFRHIYLQISVLFHCK